MVDPQLFRTDLEAAAEKLAARSYTLDVDAFRRLENERKALQIRTQDLQARRNSASKQIGIAKGRGEDASALMADVASAADELKACESELEVVQMRLREQMMEMPNLAPASGPVVRAEADNVDVGK